MGLSHVLPMDSIALWWPALSQPYSIGCAKCMQIARASNYEGATRRWQRQIAKIEQCRGEIRAKLPGRKAIRD
jgi:hypothetical protein